MGAVEGPLSNWAGNVRFGPEWFVAPRSVEELQELLASTPGKVRALGTGHSFNRIADTEGMLVSTARLGTGMVSLHARGGTAVATLAAGTRYGELTPVLDGHGWALPNLGSLPHISVGGACATGTHGSGNRNTVLAGSVRALAIVGADGELTTVTRDDDDFDGHVVALGALGIVLSMTLDLVPAYRVRQLVYEGLTRESLLGNVDALFGSAHSVSVFTTWDPDATGPSTSLLWVKQRTDEPGGADEPPHTLFGARLAASARHPVPGLDPSPTTDQLGVPGRWYQRLPHFRLDFTPSAGDELQTEYFVPRAQAAAALEAVYAIRDVVRGPLQISELRTVAADDLWLSPSYGRDSLAIHFTWHPDAAAVLPAVQAVETALAPFAPRPHWGKVFTIAPDEVRAAYPRLDDFRELSARRDPDRVFRNLFVDTYLDGC